MPRIRFINASGKERIVEGDAGQSVMEVARRNGIEGIVGECGGSCACATCHIYIDPDWQTVTGEPSADELEMLAFAIGRTAASRLSCQIRLLPSHEGLIVRIPVCQS